MSMKIFKTLAAALIGAAMALGLSTSASADGHGYGKQKVVYHVNYYDAKRQTGALRNIQNHINAVGAENLDLRVVMHGNGLSLLLEPDQVSKTKNQGVTFKICANTLKGRKVALDMLYDASESDVVPSGVAEIAHLQGQGFAYLRP